MKILFIESKRKFGNLSLNLDSLRGFKKIGLVSVVQFLPIAKRIEDFLKKNGIEVLKAKTLANEAQILGCDISAAERIKDKVQAFLLLSTGKWHALMLSELGKPVLIYNGEKIEKLDKPDIIKFRQKKKAALMRFLSEDRIGILVSTKPGQFKLKDAFMLKENLEKKGKKAFIFIADTFNLSEMENFNLKSWVNTACPGMMFDSPNIINLSDIKRGYSNVQFITEKFK
jgi:2-(3-amino-3-carboxypropyl)histidine synthase